MLYITRKTVLKNGARNVVVMSPAVPRLQHTVKILQVT